jgi:hypothetical protein
MKQIIKNIIIPIALIITVVNCGNPKTVPITSTSNSPTYGSLENFNIATNYSENMLRNGLVSQICPDKTHPDDCKNNQQRLLDDYKFDFNQIGALTQNIQAYNIIYNTPGVNHENRSVSGGILIPNLNINKIKGIILYYHPTEITKFSVPSCFKYNSTPSDYCKGKTSSYGEELGAILASQGYIVVMPDYIGLGRDNLIVHPYILFPQVNAESGLNALLATRTMLDQLHYPKLNLKLQLVGFSEGASYALHAAKLLQSTSNFISKNTKFNLENTIAISGVYDLENIQIPMEIEDTRVENENFFNISNTLNATVSKPILISYALTAYGFYQLNQKYDSLMKPEFFKCTSCIISGNRYTIPDLFNDSSLSQIDIENYIESAAATTGYGLGKGNSVKHLIKEELLRDNNFKFLVNTAAIPKWRSTTPIYFIRLAQDSIAATKNTDTAYDILTENLPSTVIRKIVIDNKPDTSRFYYYDHKNKERIPLDHQGSGTFSLIVALKEIIDVS